MGVTKQTIKPGDGTNYPKKVTNFNSKYSFWLNIQCRETMLAFTVSKDVLELLSDLTQRLSNFA
jgi:hypothetical protein